MTALRRLPRPSNWNAPGHRRRRCPEPRFHRPGTPAVSVQQTGVTINKNSGSFVLAYGVFSPDNRYDPLFISNYLDVYVRDSLKRVPGVGDVLIFGERKYAMRLWLDPVRLAKRGLTAEDVTNALAEQNVQVAAGLIGHLRCPKDSFTPSACAPPDALPMRKPSSASWSSTPRMAPSSSFATSAAPSWALKSYASNLTFSGYPAIGIGIEQLSNANALDVEKGVNAEMERLAKHFLRTCNIRKPSTPLPRFAIPSARC